LRQSAFAGTGGKEGFLRSLVAAKTARNRTHATNTVAAATNHLRRTSMNQEILKHENENQLALCHIVQSKDIAATKGLFKIKDIVKIRTRVVRGLFQVARGDQIINNIANIGGRANAPLA